MSRPIVTVLIDTFNHERFIEQAILSALEQDFPPSEREILVVDDGSTDGTAAVVQRFIPRIRYLGKANGGQASAFNAGIPEARGEIVAFLDGDDWWEPRKLSKVAEALARDAEVGMVGHGTIQVYADGRQHFEVLRKTPRFRVNSVSGAVAFRLRKSFLGTSRLVARATLLRRILPVPASLTIEADEYLFTLAAVMADVLILPEALTFYRIHAANLYQVTGFQEDNFRRKQRILASLARELSAALPRHGLSPQVVRAVTEVVSAEANQLRLTVEGGYPWETVQTEWTISRIMHEGASLAHRVFKAASLIPAFFLPPRLFYRLRRRLVVNEFYLGARRALLPFPRSEHVARYWTSGP